MSFSGRTPESLLPRSDSKNPATTCKGITTNGRPCRRALASNSPVTSPSRGIGILAVLNESTAAAFYCWQHKNQALELAQQSEPYTTLYPLQERSSIDTLVDRVGIINLGEELAPPKKVHHRKSRSSGEHSIIHRDTLPSGWQDMQSPLMTVPEEVQRRHPPRQSGTSEHKHGQSNVAFSWACCLRADDGDSEQRRPRRTQQSRPAQPSYSQVSQMTYQPQAIPSSTPVRRKHLQSPGGTSRPSPIVGSPQDQRTSETQTLLSLIPQSLSPKVTSSLLAELSRPFSPHDESGYIYIFWLTPDSDTSPDDETASSLLDEDSSHSPLRAQHRDAAIQRYASIHRASDSPLSLPKRTITLKIGRAQNVHRRMSQWSKQCGQNITLIRYYPQASKSTTFAGRPAQGTTLASSKVSNVARVERLIHLELSDKKTMAGKCDQCGREHREWFEIGASREGLRGVDEVVRRWVRWSERQVQIPDAERGSRQEMMHHVGNLELEQQQQQQQQQRREHRIHSRAWETADKARSDNWRDPSMRPTTSLPVSQGNDRGGYY